MSDENGGKTVNIVFICTRTETRLRYVRNSYVVEFIPDNRFTTFRSAIYYFIRAAGRDIIRLKYNRCLLYETGIFDFYAKLTSIDRFS